jgi:GTP-binding protein
MKFVDEASLHVKAGDGGRGCVSFRREAHVPKGGPNGGDGGKGGDIIIVGRKNLISLLDFKYKRNYKADSGKAGGGTNKTGRNGKDLCVYVPLGTEVRDEANGLLLADIVSDGQVYVAALGGRGGRGNARFVSSVQQAPTQFDDGEEGEERSLRLELKLLAGIGIIGLPNVGKSTLLSRLTAATPEVGDYPFTTLTPSLGVMMEDDRHPSFSSGPLLVLADIPGIIEGASRGKGLGLQFLRHIERTRILLWVIDVSSPDVEQDYLTLKTELVRYKQEVADRQHVVVLNKTDLVTSKELAGKKKFLVKKKEEVIPVSASDGSGIDRLKERVRELGRLTEQG